MRTKQLPQRMRHAARRDADMVREACATYVRLRGALWRLPAAHPARPALVAAVMAADRYWRALAATAWPNAADD
jgi:hypothetical protein